ncbi:MAG TPA: hypothetical protein VF292_05435 [Rhodanobacteraceae bacterium]
MRMLTRILFVLLIAGLPCYAMAGTGADGSNTSMTAAVHTLLDDYARNDQHAVVALLDPDGFTVYGSDASEMVRTVAELRDLMTADFRLWRTASFALIRDYRSSRTPTSWRRTSKFLFQLGADHPSWSGSVRPGDG